MRRLIGTLAVLAALLGSVCGCARESAPDVQVRGTYEVWGEHSNR